MKPWSDLSRKTRAQLTLATFIVIAIWVLFIVASCIVFFGTKTQ